MSVYNALAKGIFEEFTRECTSEQRKKTEHLKEGDIVIVKNDKTNRNFWRIGKIEELISGDDGMVLAARSGLVTRTETSSASRS